MTVGHEETVTHYPAPQAHRRCLAAFTQAVLESREPDPSGLDGLRSEGLTPTKTIATLREDKRWAERKVHS